MTLISATVSMLVHCKKRHSLLGQLVRVKISPNMLKIISLLRNISFEIQNQT